MKSHWQVVTLTVLLSTVIAGIANARSPHHRYKPRHPWVAAAPGGAYGPAHVIQARPGVFISSYDCVIDEGYGRYRLCSQGLK